MQGVEDLLNVLAHSPESIEFSDVMAVIDSEYHYSPVAFCCGEADNDAGTNEGSCKILAFAKMHGLAETATVQLFGRYYREDVLQNPEGTDHANIRNFMVHGWQGVSFESAPLSAK
ncbi:MAG: HopJ type III effector protein [Pseudomonadota bacterium]